MTAVEEDAASSSHRPARRRLGAGRTPGDPGQPAVQGLRGRLAQRHLALLAALAPHREGAGAEGDVRAGRARTAPPPAGRTRRAPRARRRPAAARSTGSSLDPAGGSSSSTSSSGAVSTRGSRPSPLGARSVRAGSVGDGADVAEPAEVAPQRGGLAGDAARRVAPRVSGRPGSGGAATRSTAAGSSMPGPPGPRHEPVEIATGRRRRVLADSVGQRPGELGEAPRHLAERTDRSSPDLRHRPLRTTRPSGRASPPASSRPSATATSGSGRPERSTTTSSVRASAAEELQQRRGRPASGGGRRSRRPPAGRPGLEPQRHEHVERVDRRRSAVDEEEVGPLGRRAAHRAGHGHDRHAPLLRLRDRQQRTAPDPRLHDDEHVGQRGEDAVAGREAVGRGRVCRAAPSQQSSPRSAIASQSPRLQRGYTTSSPLPTTAIGGGPPSTESAPRCGGPVDALGQTGHDGDPGRRQVPAERGRHLHAADGGVAGADDGHARRRDGAPRPSAEQHRRRAAGPRPAPPGSPADRGRRRTGRGNEPTAPRRRRGRPPGASGLASWSVLSHSRSSAGSPSDRPLTTPSHTASSGRPDRTRSEQPAGRHGRRGRRARRRRPPPVALDRRPEQSAAGPPRPRPATALTPPAGRARAGRCGG